MKRILILIIVLLIAIVTMAYLYFSGLQTGKKNNNALLYTTTANASIVFSFQNDKSIVDILAGQTVLAEIIGKERSSSLQSLNKYLLNKGTINRLTGKQNVYISFLPGENKTIDFLYSTQVSIETDPALLVNAMRSEGIRFSKTGKLTSLTLPDSSVFFLAIRGNLILLSSSANTVLKALSTATDKSNSFADFITLNSKLEKSSLAEVYINFSNLPKLLKVAIPGKLNGALSVLNNQNAFASLVYNYSTDKILLNGTTNLNGNNSYFQLYSAIRAQEISINNILPQNTANYTIYTIENYGLWSSKFKIWLDQQHQLGKTTSILKNISSKHHLDLEQVFPKYFKSQLITFQLSTSESLGAIALSNGEKFEQLLLDVSSVSGDEIKVFKESDLMYCYFGEPFKKFRKPYYVVIDNYLIFGNNESTVRSFLSSYKNNLLLINNADYINSLNQLPNSSGITFFIDFKNSADLLLKNVYLPYYRHITSREGLKNYSSLIYQLSGEQGKFQTNILLSKKILSLKTDSSVTNVDSLTALPRQVD